MAAITAVLSRYPRDVIKAVTHPVKGLPIRTNFLPTVKEVYDACEAIVQPKREAEARKKQTEKVLAERLDRERALSVTSFSYAPGTAEAGAVRVLHEIVGRHRAYREIFKRPDGSVTYTKEMTPQLTALAQASDEAGWVTLNHKQAGAWEALLKTVFDERLVRQHMRDGSKAPWPWPPSIEGKLYTDAGGPPPLTDEDARAFANEGQR